MRIYSTTLYGDLEAIMYENEQIEVTILPARGGEIHQIRFLPLGLDCLYINDAEIARYQVLHTQRNKSQETPNDHFLAGLLTLFPNAGNASTYNGFSYPFHGDLRDVSWDCQHDGQARITLQARSACLPFALDRSIAFDGSDATIVVTDTLSYLAQPGTSPRLPFIYALHPYHSGPFVDEHTVCRLGSDAIEIEPLATGAVNRLDFLAVDDRRFIEWVNPRSRLCFRLSFDPGFFRYVWVWFNVDPASKRIVAALLPSTHFSHDGIQSAVDDGTALWMIPGEQITTHWQISVERTVGNMQ